MGRVSPPAPRTCHLKSLCQDSVGWISCCEATESSSLVNQSTGTIMQAMDTARKHASRQSDAGMAQPVLDSRWAISLIAEANLVVVIENHERKPFDFFQQ